MAPAHDDADDTLTVAEEARLLREEALATRRAFRLVHDELRRTVEALHATVAAAGDLRL